VTGKRNGGGVPVLLTMLGLFCSLSLAMLLSAPAIAARIALSGAPALAPHLQEWLWPALGSPLLALVLVRLALARNGRLRGRSTPPVKRWLGMLKRASALLGVVNITTFVQLTRAGRTDYVIADGMPVFVITALVGIAVLVAIAVWDRRSEPVTVEEVRAAAAEADRTLRRIRAENERVRQQAEQVQARLTKLRAQARRTDRPKAQVNGKGRGQPVDRSPARSDVDFHALRTFHRESYQCADTAHVAYQSTQASLHTMSSVVSRARLAPQHWLSAGRAAKLARAEMRAAASHLTRSYGELRAQVEQGLGMVRTLNANTADLKHEIRDSCGEPGRQWFEALEQRIEEARNERRASRIG